MCLPGNNAVSIFISLHTETSRFDRKFYFSEKFLDIKLESIEREVKKRKKKQSSPDSNIKEKEKDEDSRISNDSQLTQISQMETESLSDLDVQRQYYYCKPDDKTLSTASQKIWKIA